MIKEKEIIKSLSDIKNWNSIFDRRLFSESGKLLCLDKKKYYTYFANTRYGFSVGYTYNMSIDFSVAHRGLAYCHIKQFFLENGIKLIHKTKVLYGPGGTKPEEIGLNTTMWEGSLKAGFFYDINKNELKTGNLTDREITTFKKIHTMNVHYKLANESTLDINDINEWLEEYGSNLRVVSIKQFAKILNNKLPKEPKKEVYRKLLKRAPIK